MSASLPSGLGAATAQVLEKVVDREVEVRLLVVHPIEAERAEQRLDVLARPLADHQVAAGALVLAGCAAAAMPRRSKHSSLTLVRWGLPALPVIGNDSKCSTYAGTMWLGRSRFRCWISTRSGSGAPLTVVYAHATSSPTEM